LILVKYGIWIEDSYIKVSMLIGNAPKSMTSVS